MVLIGEEYVRRELEFVTATCKVIEYYSQSYGYIKQPGYLTFMLVYGFLLYK